MDNPIFITGAARSGTSMTAGIIELCGAFGGKTSGPTKYNKKGMFENAEVRNKIVKPYLKEVLHVDPMGQKPLPDVKKLSPMLQLRIRMETLMAWQGYDQGPWYYKGAKLCLIWPEWHRAFPEAKWLIVRREDRDVVRSCMLTGFMRAYKDEAGWQEWLDTHKTRFEEMKKAGLDVQEVWPTKFVEGNFEEIEQVVKNLGLEWKSKKVFDFITPSLWRSWKNGKQSNDSRSE